jgi:uncharacterized protein (UPF0303 family)
MPETDYIKVGDTTYTFGVEWAPRGDRRYSNYRTLLAHAYGHKGGAFLVGMRNDPTPGWVTVPQWDEWVASTHAAPVDPALAKV